MNNHDFEIYLRNTLRAIQREYHKAYPEGKYLSLSIRLQENGNGNDDGDWDSWYMQANNEYYNGVDAAFPVDFWEFEDVKDEKYYACDPEDNDPIEAVRW